MHALLGMPQRTHSLHGAVMASKPPPQGYVGGALKYEYTYFAHLGCEHTPMLLLKLCCNNSILSGFLFRLSKIDVVLVLPVYKPNILKKIKSKHKYF